MDENKHILLEICERFKNGLSWEKICKEYGGISVYVPKVSPTAKDDIKAEFNGYNTAFLAYKYNLSQNSVRSVVRESKKDNTPSLFDENWHDDTFC